MAALFGALPPGPVGKGTPSPSTQGDVCAPGPWNWGDPGDVPGACGDHLAASFHSGDVLLEGGVGQGVVAVRGDADLTDKLLARAGE